MRRWLLAWRPTADEVLGALADWASISEVAQRLGTRRYGAVTRALHVLHESGRTEDRWIADGRRQYRAKQPKTSTDG